MRDLVREADKEKMIIANRLQPALWDMTLDGQRIALISIAPAESTTVVADNQTMSLATLPTMTDLDTPQITNTTGSGLTAIDFQIVFYETRSRIPLTVAEVCSPLIFLTSGSISIPSGTRRT